MERAYGSSFTRILATGAPAPNATVTVFNSGTMTLSTIFADNGNPPTPKANPFSADANGYWFFYADGGRYDVQFSGGGIVTPYTLGDVLLGGAITINGQSADTHNFAVGTAGTDFAVSSATVAGVATHTWNLPSASAANRGVVTTGAQTLAGAKTFSTPIAPGSGGTGLNAAPANGQLLIGAGGTVFALATLTAGANMTITNGAGSITLASAGNLVSLNGLTAAAQTFAIAQIGSGTPSGLSITSVGSVHTFGIDVASSGNPRGLVSNIDQDFGGIKQFQTGAPKFFAGGQAASEAIISGRIFTNLVSAGNAAGMETVLKAYTLVSNTLNADGKALRVTSWGITAANANAKTIRLRLGAVNIASITGTFNNLPWFSQHVIAREAVAAQRSSGAFTVGTSLNVNSALPAANLATSVVIDITGEGAGTDDVILQGMMIEVIG